MNRGFTGCFLLAATLLLTIGSVEAFSMYQQFSFSGEIDFVLVDNAPEALTGFDVGTPVSGTFRYGVDVSDAVVTPHGDNETDYQFLGLPYYATLHSTTPARVITDTTVVVSDHTWTNGPGVVELGQILGVTIQDGDPFDGWTVRTDEEPIDDIALGVTFFAFSDTGLLDDQNYRSGPPAGIGVGGFDGAVFRILETNATGEVTFEGLGRVDSYSVSVTTIPAPGALLLAALGSGLVMRRRRL